jgi:hypothetical protein
MEHALRSVNHLSNFKLEAPKLLKENGVVLAQRKLSFMDEKLSAEQRKFLSQYKNPMATMWTTEDNDLSVEPKVKIMVLNGLASNPSQFVRENSSIIHSICEELGIAAEQIQIVSISPPGFGDSGLKEANLDNVRTREYKALTKIWLDQLGSDPENTIIVGHSTGAETALQFSEDGYDVIALNPSVHLGESTIFRNLDILNTASDKLRLSSLSLVKQIAQGVTNGLVGISKKNDGDQSNMHIAEESFNHKAFLYKCRELKEIDELPGFPKRLPSFFYTTGDILTPGADAVEWYTAWVRKYWSEFKIEPEEAGKYVAGMLIPIDAELSKKAGHDGIFVNKDVAKPFISQLAQQVKWMIEKTPYVQKEFAPVQAIQIPERKMPVQSEDQVKKLIYQGFTLESWAEISNVLSRKIGEDQKIHLSPQDKKYLIDLVFKHPVLQDHFAGKTDELAQMIKAPFLFFEKYYFTGSDLEDYFKFYLGWGPVFTNALNSDPDISVRIPGSDYNDNRVSSILSGAKEGVSVAVSLSAMSDDKSELVLDVSDVANLLKYREALELFQNAVRSRLAHVVSQTES